MKRHLKAFLRRRAPKLYDELILLAYGRSARRIQGFGSRLHFRKLIQSQRPFCLDVCNRQGFGGTLSQVINLHHFFEKQGCLAKVVSSNPLYVDGNSSADMIEMFFDRVGASSDKVYEPIKYRYPEDVTLQSMDNGLTLMGAHDLFFRNYAVKERFLDEARSFYSSNFNKALGVHFRGSDKRLEAIRVQFDDYVKTIDDYFEQTGIDQLFIATDELSFVQAMQRRYGPARAKALDCKYLSDGFRGSHYLSGDGFEKGREALVTMLILSMCTACLRGASHLSAWSKILNPELPVIMFGNPFYTASFPENEMLRTAARPALNFSR